MRKFTTFITGLILLYAAITAYFYTVQDRSIFPSKTIPQSFQFDYSTPFEEIFLDANDGARIHGVVFSATNAQGVVLYFHGNASNMLHMEYAAKPFLSMGYDFLAMDYRTYGKSSGELSEQALFDDAALFYDLLIKRGWDESKILLMGRSIGTGIATQLASQTNPAGLILYSPYYSMTELASEKMPFLPIRLLLRYPLDTAYYLSKVGSPVLILHGDKDTLIPISHAERLEEIKGKLVRFPEAGHNNLNRFKEYQSSISVFLNEVL